MFSTNRTNIALLICTALMLRIVLSFVAVVGAELLPEDRTFMHYPVIIKNWTMPSWLHGFANFDGVHYTTIAQKGYLGTANIQAFFPLFPALIAALAMLVQNQVLAGLILSNLAFIALVPAWYFFVRTRFGSNTAAHATAVLLTFPTAFFFGSLYTESLFLLCSIGVFWSIERKKPILTLLCILLATATKVVGTALIPAALLHLLWQNKEFQQIWYSIFSRETLRFSREKLRKYWGTFYKACLETLHSSHWHIAAILSGSIGLLGYMLYLYRTFGDPLYFFSVQKAFGGIRETELVSYPRVVFRSLNVLRDTPTDSLRFFPYLQEFLAGAVGMGATLLAVVYTKIPPAYLLFGALSMLIPAATGTFSSMPRYILVNFALYLCIAQVLQKYPKLQVAWYTISCILLCINTILFTQGYWVA